MSLGAKWAGGWRITRGTVDPGNRGDPPVLERERLATLRRFGVLDTPAEVAFDDLAEMAAQLCDTPMALVSLVDEQRQWFKARVGLDAHETSREMSFCAHALAGPHPLIVEDAAADPRFVDNDLVTGEPHLRFYAGIPLVVDGGHVLGTLCVLDVVPRSLTPVQLRQLQVLARQVVSQLELRRQSEALACEVADRTVVEAALRASETRYRALFESSPVGSAETLPDGTLVAVNPRLCQMLGYSAEELIGRPYWIMRADLVDGDHVVRSFVGVGASATIFDRRLFRRKDGSTLPVLIAAVQVPDGDGQVSRLLAKLVDVTSWVAAEDALRISETRYRALFEASPVGSAEYSSDGTLLAVNPQLCRMLGYHASELVGQRAQIMQMDPDDGDRALARLIERPAEPGFSRQRYRHKDGTGLDVLVGVAQVRDEQAKLDRLLATMVDISAQVNAEQRLDAAHADLAARKLFTDAVLDSIDVGIVACDAAGTLTVFNPVARGWHGLDIGSDLDAASDSDHFAENFSLYAGDGSVLAADSVPLMRALRDGSVRDAEIVIAPPGRPATRVLCSGQTMVAEDGSALGAVVAMTDITAARAATVALAASEHRFRTTFLNDPAGLAVVTVDGRALQVNLALSRLLGRTESALLEVETLSELAGPNAAVALAELSAVARSSTGTSVASEQRLLHSNGSEMWALITATQFSDPIHGDCVLVQLEDVTARKQAEDRLTRQALYDGLTNLPNRSMLLDRIRLALARLDRRPGDGMVALLFCDLNGFKVINDRNGHAAGDAVLAEVSHRLAAAMRPTDTVARLGGDEFVVLCENLPDADIVDEIAKRLERSVAEPIEWQQHQLAVTVSIGIVFATVTSTPDELIRQADRAMYAAKLLGRDRRPDS